MQDALFAKIKDTMDNPKDLAKDLQTLLDISSDAAYRRLRGDTALTIDEAYILGHHYKISLSELEGFRKEHVTFAKRPLVHQPQEFEAFLVRGLEQLQALGTDSDHEMIVAAKDVPSFYQYKYKGLGSFRLFLLMQSAIDDEHLKGKQFSMEDIPQNLLEVVNQHWLAYNELNAVEFWNAATLDGLATQILFCYEAGLFVHKKEALLLCDELQNMLKHLYKQAVYGKRISQRGRPSRPKFTLYYNEIMVLDNSILSRIKSRFIYNMPYGGVNYLSSNNEELSSDLQAYFTQQTQKSTAITEVSEKERNLFFQQLRNRVEALRTSIESSVPFEA